MFWPGEVNGLYSPQGHKKSDTTEQPSLSFQAILWGIISLPHILKVNSHVLFWGDVSLKKVPNCLLTFFLGSQLAGSRASSWRREALSTPSPTWVHTAPPSACLVDHRPHTAEGEMSRKHPEKSLPPRHGLLSFCVLGLFWPLFPHWGLVTYLVFHKLRSLSSS